MSLPRVAVLGAGPAGLAAAWLLHRNRKGHAMVLEQRDQVGGNAGSFVLEGLPVDYGSHRLHPACDPTILADIRSLLGADLVDRPRHGRIRLRDTWVNFPIRVPDVARLPPAFGFGVVRDSLRKLIPSNESDDSATFASVLEHGLGSTICRDFYFPYAVKIWGIPPNELSAMQARRRVSAGSLTKMLGKVLRTVPGLKPPGTGRFFYPRQGYGQISDAIAAAASNLGASMRLGASVRRVRMGTPLHIEMECAGSPQTIEADYVWSSIPVTLLSHLLDPPPPAAVVHAREQITYRAMVLIYLVLEQAQFTPFDAHYFPESTIALTRLSEPKNYSARTDPANRTVLCGELPCAVDDEIWRASDEDLGALVCDALAHCGLPIRAPILRVVCKRLPFAYPIYRRGYETHLQCLDDWVSGLDGILTFGRQGLFAHDNTHHTIATAYGAVDCLSSTGRFDWDRWRVYRSGFEQHVVED